MPQVFDSEDSGMYFIRNNAFRIENSDVHNKVKSNGIKTVEFIRIIENRLHFVEAKKSLHDPQGGERAVRFFQEEIGEIRDKFIHSLNLFASIKVGVNEANFADDFVMPKNILLVFLLVVKEHDEIQCKSTYAALNSSLKKNMPHYWLHIWKPIIEVFGYEKAVKQNFVVE